MAVVSVGATPKHVQREITIRAERWTNLNVDIAVVIVGVEIRTFRAATCFGSQSVRVRYVV